VFVSFWSLMFLPIFLYFFSAATCAYIVSKLFELPPSGPSQDPLDLLLLRYIIIFYIVCRIVVNLSQIHNRGFNNCDSEMNCI
jgi:hypothetical protein